jgi:hypothetical protein
MIKHRQTAHASDRDDVETHRTRKRGQTVKRSRHTRVRAPRDVAIEIEDHCRPEGRKVRNVANLDPHTTQYFVKHVMVPLVQTIFPQGRIWSTPQLNIHLDNYTVHFSKVTEQFSIENQLLHVPHQFYSPYLAPSDFWLFARIKTGLAGRSFAEPEE